ncbi:hypothetical protein Y032_1226g3770 [Ancylostoma ceylanicum]|uniref:Uncharacterized protein n=1 Tax=Ancylostoma ceylanicum TaxID=53326 RepID=A0A016W5V3_9BILA|nr:hypothetical protein Y032_1226g3770 [Ancylostoma ceylanicum]
MLVDCGGKGRISDSGLFRTSPINAFLEAHRVDFPPSTPLGDQGVVDYHILADGGFGQTTWIQRPFLQAEAEADERKSHFNKCFSSYVYYLFFRQFIPKWSFQSTSDSRKRLRNSHRKIPRIRQTTRDTREYEANHCDDNGLTYP